MLTNPGNICGLSMIAIPALLRSNQGKSTTPPTPNTLAQQWQTLYNAGKAQNPPIAAVTASSFLYLAWAARSQGAAVYSQLAGKSSNTGVFYCGAALLTLGIVPWTLVAMMSTNHRLESIAGSGDGTGASVSDEEFDGLVKKWQGLNLIRGLFPLAGGLLGLVVALC